MSASSKKKLRKEQNAAAMTEKQLQAEREAKKLKNYTTTFVVAIILVVAIMIGVAVRIPITGAIDRNTAAITVGSHELSTTDFSYYYVDAINKYYNEAYSYYGSYVDFFLGFDLSKPLNAQAYGTGGTWADHFMKDAKDNAKNVLSLYEAAVAAGHELTEEDKESLESALDSTELMAAYYGYSSVDAYLRATYGAGANMKTYKNYYTINTLASSYYDAYAEDLKETYTDEDLRAYESDNYHAYSSFNFAIYTVKVSDYLTGGTKDSSGNTTYTDAEKAAAAKDAAEVAKTLSSGKYADLNAFNKAIKGLDLNKNKTVTATEYTNTLYDDISNEEIQEWLAKRLRDPKDVKSFKITSTSTDSNGKETTEVTSYQIVYFISRDENKTNLVDVMHILVQFEGGTTDSSGKKTYSDAEKAKAKEEAEKLLKQWQEGEKADKDAFAELAKKESDDTGSKENGGLYEDVYPHQMVTAFNDWCFDAARKAGDTGIVETEYGYHVMYFVETKEETYRDYMISYAKLNEEMTAWHDGLKEKTVITEIDLSRMEWDKTMK